MKKDSATLKLIIQLVLTSGLSIYAQRVGDRNNDYKTSEAGRFSFMDIFYSFHHPIYREIEYRDLRNKAIYPEEISAQLNKNLTFSSTTLSSKNQGGDFMLEQKIQRQKMLAPKGVVEKHTWQQISRSIDKIDEIHNNASNLMNISDNPQITTCVT